MRRSVAALALIQRSDGPQLQWLVQWNGKWNGYFLPGGHRLPGETFRDCLRRELHEELGLREGEHFALGPQPRARLNYEAWSESAQQQTDYCIELFEVSVLSKQAERLIAANPSNRWVAAEEIRAGKAVDGRPVTSTTRRILAEARLLPPAVKLTVKPDGRVKELLGRLCRADCPPAQTWQAAAKGLLERLYVGAAAKVEVTKWWVSSSQRSLMCLVNLRDAPGGPQGCFRRDVVKIGQADRLAAERTNYAAHIEPRRLTGFIAATALASIGSLGALAYVSAEAAEGSSRTDLVTLQQFCCNRLDRHVRRIIERFGQLFEGCLRAFYTGAGHSYELPSDELVQFWRAKWQKFVAPGGGAYRGPASSAAWQRLPLADNCDLASKSPAELEAELLADFDWQTLIATGHGDLNLTNILAAGDQVYLIDYEDVRPQAHVMYDLVKLEVEFSNHVLSALPLDEHWLVYRLLNWVCAASVRAGERKGEQSGWCGRLKERFFPHSDTLGYQCQLWQWALRRGRARNGFRLLVELRRLAEHLAKPPGADQRWWFDYCRWVSLYAFITLGFKQLDDRQKLAALTTAYSSLQFWRARHES